MDFSFQLYSARKHPIADVLKELAALGYTQVEGFGGLYDDVDGLKRMLDENGLKMPTAHIGHDQLKDKDGTLRIVKTLGIEHIYCPHVSPDAFGRSDDAWKEFAQMLAEFGKVYKGEGYGFGWHNHHFEFWRTDAGSTPMQIILDTAPEIEWEMDVAWVVKGDEDPRAWMERYGERITAVHVKDIAPEGQNADEDGWADIGHGRLEWSSLIKDVRTRTKAKYFVAEHDNPADAVRFARRSIEAVKGWN